MGSSHSGNLSDYPRSRPTSQGANNGGSSGLDKCGNGFSTSLDEVSRCFYFMNTATLPPLGTKVNISFNGIRLVAETTLGEEIGYLPTQYNYLKLCIDNGFNYTGEIISARTSPITAVMVDIIPV